MKEPAPSRRSDRRDHGGPDPIASAHPSPGIDAWRRRPGFPNRIAHVGRQD